MTRQKTPPNPASRRPMTLVLVGAAIVISVGFLVRPKSPAEPDPTPPATIALADTTPPARVAVYLPAEFAPQEYLLLGGSQLVNLFPQVLADIVAATAGEIDLRILVGNQADHVRIDSVLAGRTTTAEIIDLPVRSMWARDFGPLTVKNQRGDRHLVDFHYRERRGNRIDNDVPGYVGQKLGLKVQSSELLVEGGDLVSNGRGFCLLSTRVVNRNAHYRELEPRQTVNQLAALLGFENLTLAPPLKGESTGHVDMFAAFVAVDLVLVGQYDPQDDAENAAQLDAVAADLATQYPLGGPLRVERIPMPDHNDGVWRTYTNIVFANGVLLVPVYPDYCPEMDAVALATYRQLLPDRRIVGVNASDLIRMNGALRCITMNVPR